MATPKKNYMVINNWTSMPHIKGLKFSYGNMHRTFCRCGYTHTDIVSECLNCGNKNFIQSGESSYEYSVLDRKRFLIEKRRITHSIQQNHDFFTNISQTVQREQFYLTNTGYELDAVLDALPELKDTDEVKLTTQLIEYLIDKQYLSNSRGWTYNSSRLTVFRFCYDRYRENPNITIEDLIDLIQYFHGGDVVTKMSYTFGFNEPMVMLKQLGNISLPLQIMCKDLAVFRLLFKEPTTYKKMDVEVSECIAAYYAEGYVDGVYGLLNVVGDYKFNSTTRTMFIKFFKENFANPGYNWSNIQNMLNWVEKGNSFENTKDYFLQRNVEKLTRGYNKKNVDLMLVNVYKHPTDALIELINSK
jgi:hypothetical protein